MFDNRIVGTNRTPRDLVAKITGRARYAEDFRAEGMAFAKLLLSPMPRARVVAIDARDALSMEGVLGVLTPEDVAAVAGEPPLTNEPLYQGQPIAAIAAVDETVAAEAVERLRVEYEPLPFVLDPLDSLRPDGPNALDGGNTYIGNEVGELKWTAEQAAAAGRGEWPDGAEDAGGWSFGDVEAGFAAAELVVSEPIIHQSQTHHPLEPRTAMAYWANGKCYLHVSTQSLIRTRPAHATRLGIDEDDLVVIGEYCGGGFGSKVFGTVTDVIPAFLSRKIGRPVMMRVTRDEETYFGRARTGLTGWTRIGFRGDGRITAIDLFLIQDNGPYGRLNDVNSCANIVSLAYQPEAMRFRNIVVFTNTPPRAAQRAPGGVQAVAMFAPLISRGARELGLDPLDVMRINAPAGRAPMGPARATVTSALVTEAIDLGRRLFRYDEKRRLARQRNGPGVTGIGVALSPYTAGSVGFDGLMVLRPDGRLHVHQGIGNLGTHSIFDTAFPAAEILGLDWDDVMVVWGDTSRGVPWSSIQAGSQTTHAHTRANHAAAMDARRKLQEIAARELGGSPADYEVGGGRVFRRTRPGTGMTLARAAERAIELGGRYDGHELPDDIHAVTAAAATGLAGQGLMGVATDDYGRRSPSTYSFVVAFCLAEVDRETGVIDVREVLAVTDCGTVLHPRSLAAQLHGGVIQGMSVARFEKWAFDPRWGVNSNKRFYTAKPISILDLPTELQWAAVDEPDPDSPVGAKGIGEPPIGAGAGAIIDAVADALGIVPRRTPLTPDKILSIIEGLEPGYAPLQTNV